MEHPVSRQKMNFTDVHFHGCAGHKTIELNRKAYEEMSRYLFEEGGTGFFLAGFSAAPLDSILKYLDFCRELMRDTPLPGAQLAGVYLEGPFVRIAGGMSESLLRNPTLAAARRIAESGRGIVRNITIAPELPGALETIEYFASEGFGVSAGHFRCSDGILREAVKRGVTRITHFCNNTEGDLICPDGRYFTEGPFLEILADDRLLVEMICDGVHVDPRLVKAVRRVKGREKFLPVTDGCAAIGMKGTRLRFPNPDGSVSEFDVRDGALYIADSSRLTGSLATMKIIYNNLMKFCGMTAEEAEYACSEFPRKLAGVCHV